MAGLVSINDVLIKAISTSHRRRGSCARPWPAHGNKDAQPFWRTSKLIAAGVGLTLNDSTSSFL